MIIRTERPDDISAIFQVEAAAFETDMEARLVDILRGDGDLTVSLVAENDGEIVGHIALSPMQGPVRTMGLGPVAVRPDLQKRGIGSKLINAALDIARNMDIQAVFLLGHAEYYPRFGFSPELAAPFTSPFAGPNFMAKELEKDCLKDKTGKVEYAPGFSKI
ncbi:MAG: N-acetyltransferase [Acidimicrobiales bacterium]|nr:N-acetyltransferase [Hyphomonadaceae bacterium]RZV43092.1 MAG: N-acetyltransferase [Acidimicrobiales bacterium]